MTRPRFNRRRGLSLYMLLPMIAIVGVFCSIAVDRSLEAYRAAGMMGAQLEARAAAEGAVALLSRTPEATPSNTTIGRTEVSFDASHADGEGALVVPIHLCIIASESAQPEAFDFGARFTRTGGGPWQFASLHAR